MAGKYDDLAAQIVELVGGKSNVKCIAHCITRVRFKLKDESKANDEAISELPNVIRMGTGILLTAAIFAYAIYFGRPALKAGLSGDVSSDKAGYDIVATDR